MSIYITRALENASKIAEKVAELRNSWRFDSRACIRFYYFEIALELLIIALEHLELRTIAPELCLVICMVLDWVTVETVRISKQVRLPNMA